ncbi:hypothetical protein FQN55_006492 [Onygenales sp. PD_40]|nr:hypothetical protein FQN55_006492 [Onygenales sp. PD_40]KAK2779118.1 hypothetical protein FQN53_001554 [Emmonsiellopsis sp. PD_33]
MTTPPMTTPAHASSNIPTDTRASPSTSSPRTSSWADVNSSDAGPSQNPSTTPETQPRSSSEDIRSPKTEYPTGGVTTVSSAEPNGKLSATRVAEATASAQEPEPAREAPSSSGSANAANGGTLSQAQTPSPVSTNRSIHDLLAGRDLGDIAPFTPPPLNSRLEHAGPDQSRACNLSREESLEATMLANMPVVEDANGNSLVRWPHTWGEAQKGRVEALASEILASLRKGLAITQEVTGRFSDLGQNGLRWSEDPGNDADDEFDDEKEEEDKEPIEEKD